MSLCAACGLQLNGDSALCAHHHSLDADNWAIGNRVMCDFLHRGKEPARLSHEDRRDDLPETAPDAACLLVDRAAS